MEQENTLKHPSLSLVTNEEDPFIHRIDSVFNEQVKSQIDYTCYMLELMIDHFNEYEEGFEQDNLIRHLVEALYWLEQWMD